LSLNDPYEILGLRSTASQDEIKKAYRGLARERHPDTDRGNPWAEDEFKELSRAYAILSDPKTRAKYDRGEIDGKGAVRAGGGRTKPATGRAWKPGSQRPAEKRTPIKIHGTDVEYDLTVPFLDAAKGCVKHVSMTNGKRLKVSIPRGTEDGTLLRLKGQGMPGIGGGRDGDALVEVSVATDPVFRSEETDIHIELAVSLPEAVLGCKIAAPTIDGPVTVMVPACSNTGTILRLKGKGLHKKPDKGSDKAANGGEARGDQYVTLKVILPRKPDQSFVDFITDWSVKNNYTVRPKS